ncbi:MBL fold metallo-hydrolase [Clostridium vitabionis]|jgi:L-ascorbate metabolism protein UlaG (beta-lactamase superfamily)|uniref:MBL fold metallo-hydrolase n=1 Tax=Clostridium vitabionis TaxID=2784388 RepID=UPI001F1F00EF|nr:MBL fold metallo-hydrolase [Clostridium vitabionis]
MVTQMGNVKITWLGHSCMAVEKEDYRIVFDPYGDNTVPGYPPLRTDADLVLCSHGHSDHNAAELIQIRQDAEKKENPWKITELSSFHDENGGKDRGTNTIRILDDGEYRIAHMGDLGCALTPEQKRALSGLDVMLVPVGGFFTLEPDRIHAIVQELQPTVVVPMHYRFGAYGYPKIGTLDAYTSLCDDVVIYDGNSLELPEDGAPQTAVLKFTE